METLLEDSRLRPDVFQWNGPVEAERLATWLDGNGLTAIVPQDLVTLWLLTGGGDIFESETLLGPFGDVTLGDDVVEAKAFLRSTGLPSGYLVFSRGFTLGAVEHSTGEFVELDSRDFRVTARFSTLDDWYRKSVRAEFASRYRLA